MMMITHPNMTMKKAKEYCKNVIRELVDNPPLKFEDLHEGMWVWDEKIKSII